MIRLRLIAVVIAILATAGPAFGHATEFSYIELKVAPGLIEATVVAHIFDAAHDLKVEQPPTLLDPAVLSQQSRALVALMTSRLQVMADGRPLTPEWSPQVEPLADRQSLGMHVRIPTLSPPGKLTVTALLFPYESEHQTFLNITEGETFTQSILNVDHKSFDYFLGSRQGAFAVVKKFLPAGIHHILIGPDHLLFLVGLLLLGGSLKQLAFVVSSFTLAHSITLSLAALNIVSPPARIIEPAIALSIVYVGFDNLTVRGGRDARAWIAFVFGFIHGFGFASVLREMDLPPRALGWSLFSFNVGVEIGQLLVVIVVASALAMLRSRSQAAGRRLAFAGSIVVIVAGTFWFVQRVFFPGGI